MATPGAVFIHSTETSKICTQLLCAHAPILFFTHLFPSQKHDSEVVVKSGSQAVWHRTAKGREEPISALCTAKLHHAKWISNLTQSWSNGHIWESSQHSPCLFYIHNQHSNGCQGLLVLFGFFSLSVSCFLSHCGLQLSIQDVLWHYEIVTAAEEMLCYKHAMMQWTGKSIWLEKWRGARGKKLFQSSWTK